MKKKSSLNFNKQRGKNKKAKTQLQTIFHYLRYHVATATMVTHETGIAQKCVTRYKRDLEKADRLWEVRKGHCQITGHLAWFITTNSELAPDDRQLHIFDE